MHMGHGMHQFELRAVETFANRCEFQRHFLKVLLPPSHAIELARFRFCGLPLRLGVFARRLRLYVWMCVCADVCVCVYVGA